MEIYELGYLVFGFIAGMAWGIILISVIYFYHGKRKKVKSETENLVFRFVAGIEDRLTKIEERLGL